MPDNHSNLIIPPAPNKTSVVEHSYFAHRLRGVASVLASGERDTDFIMAALDPIELRNLVIDLLREVAEAIENGGTP